VAEAPVGVAVGAEGVEDRVSVRIAEEEFEPPPVEQAAVAGHEAARRAESIAHRPLRRRAASKLIATQLSWANMSFPLAVVSGTVWRTSQCSIILPSSSKRQMSIAAMLNVL
jgi:hypothetical protein